jgi:hypothetical protein
VTRAVPERKSRLRRLALGRGAASLALGCALIAGLKLWLVADDEVVARAIPHDHQRYAEMAFEIVHGRWLGDYDHMTLIREPAYPVWIAGVHATGVPLRLAAEVLLAASAALFVAALRLAGAPTALALGCFGLLVLQPHSFLVNRELLAAGFYLPVLLIAMSGLLLAARAASLRHRAVHAVWTGLALGALWTTRPEKPLVVVVIAAFALLDLARRRAGGATWRRAAGPVGVPVMGAVLGIATAAMGFSALNHRHYGMFVTSDLSAPGFVAANAALLGIEQAAPRRFVLVPRDVRERAYAASPAFHELRPWLEAPSAGRSVSCNLVNVCDDFAGAWFMWTLREAAARAGHMDSAIEADLFFQRIADEIARARVRGELPAERANLPPLHPRPETYLAHLAGSFRRIAWRVAMPGEWSDWDPLGDDLATPEPVTQLFDEIANRRPRLSESNSASVEGWAAFARDPAERVTLRRARVGGGLVADEPGQPVEIGSVRVQGMPRGRVRFRFDVKNSAGAFHSMEPTVVFSRASGATTELSLPQAGDSAERDGIRVVVEAVTERESDGPARRGIRRALWRAHALGVRVLTLLGVVAAALLVLPPWRGRRPDLVVEALGLILVIVVARVAMLTALDAGSLPAWSSRYVYPVVSLTSCGLLLLVFEALRHHTRRAVAK